MNERIQLIHHNCVSIVARGDGRGGSTVNLEIEGDLHTYHMGTVAWDSKGRDALIDALQCLRDTGSFAALADTSAVPYIGKRVCFDRHSGAIGTVAAIEGGSVWLEHDWHFYCRQVSELHPLAGTTARYRPYTPREAVEFLGREVAWRGRYYYLEGVHSDHLELSVADDGKFPRIGYEHAIEQLKWRDTGEPCGVKEG